MHVNSIHLTDVVPFSTRMHGPHQSTPDLKRGKVNNGLLLHPLPAENRAATYTVADLFTGSKTLP